MRVRVRVSSKGYLEGLLEDVRVRVRGRGRDRARARVMRHALKDCLKMLPVKLSDMTM